MIRPSHVRSAASWAARPCGPCRPTPGLAQTSSIKTAAPAPTTFAHAYATHHQTSTASSSSKSSTPRRRAVTPFNDDGNVPWTDLSVGEKTARAAQQTFNFGMVVVGVALTGGIVYLLFTEVFSPDSKVSSFNRAVTRIKSDDRCVEVLGDSHQITAYGEETGNKWRRARPIASTASTDSQGNEHLVMQFNVQGPRAQGTAYLHLVKARGHDEFVYRYFYLDVPGKDRVYLEDNRAIGGPGSEKKRTLFGINWSSSK